MALEVMNLIWLTYDLCQSMMGLTRFLNDSFFTFTYYLIVNRYYDEVSGSSLVKSGSLKLFMVVNTATCRSVLLINSLTSSSREETC